MKVTIDLVEGKSFECNGVVTFTEAKYATQYINSVDPNQERWLKFKFEVDFGEHQYTGNFNTGSVKEDFCFIEHVKECLIYFSTKCPYGTEENKQEAKQMLNDILKQLD